MSAHGPKAPRPPASDVLLVTPEEAAYLMRVGRDRVYQMIASGELPSLKLGASRRIRRGAIEEHLRALEAAPSAE